jgi:hypothetical protein
MSRPRILVASMSSMEVSAWSTVSAIFTGVLGRLKSMMSTPVPGQASRHFPTKARSL